MQLYSDELIFILTNITPSVIICHGCMTLLPSECNQNLLSVSDRIKFCNEYIIALKCPLLSNLFRHGHFTCTIYRPSGHMA